MQPRDAVADLPVGSVTLAGNLALAVNDIGPLQGAPAGFFTQNLIHVKL
jgi:hypothetical protein